MFSFKELVFVYCVGALLYSFIEVFFRGYTHWSMVLTGGACFLLFYIMNFTLNIGIIGKCFLASFIITSLEFVVGYFVNIVFKLNVWSYAGMPYNYLGQICLVYSGIWFLFGIPMTFLSNYIRGLV